MDTNRKLIFDLGMHKGLDARNYLAKGFDVVGLEAVPALCDRVRDENSEMIASGRLKVVQGALYSKTGQWVDFHVNPDHDDWGSLEKGAAEKGVGSSTPIEVETITLGDLFQAYGSPYYIKCDLEGGDAIFAVQLLRSSMRPEFVSIEATSADDLAMIRACGYTRFQVINQWTHPFTVCPNPAREGSYVDLRFTHEMSGLFGRDLDPAKWIDFTATMSRFLDWYGLHKRDTNLAIGWLDVHATTAETLRQP